MRLFEQATAVDFVGIDHDWPQTITKGHGRIETRRCWTLSDLSYLSQQPRWRGLQTIIMVQSERRIQGKVSVENRYFISSLPNNAAQIASAVRSHWQIENSLHWVLDVSFREDACRIRKNHAPENLAVLRHLALNLLSQEHSTRRSVAAKRKKAAWDNSYLLQVLSL